MIAALVKAGSERFGSEGRFAEAVGLTPQQISKRKLMTVETTLREAVRMAEVLEVSLDEYTGLRPSAEGNYPSIADVERLIDSKIEKLNLPGPPSSTEPWGDSRELVEQSMKSIRAAADEVLRTLHPEDKERKRDAG